MVTSTALLLSYRYPLDRKLSGPKKRCRRGDELFLTVPGVRKVNCVASLLLLSSHCLSDGRLDHGNPQRNRLGPKTMPPACEINYITVGYDSMSGYVSTCSLRAPP